MQKKVPLFYKGDFQLFVLSGCRTLTENANMCVYPKISIYQNIMLVIMIWIYIWWWLWNKILGLPFDFALSFQWRHNGRDDVSNHQPHHCLVNRLFKRRSKKTSKLRVIGFCAGNSPVTGEFPEQRASNADRNSQVTGEFPAQRASNADNVSIWWRDHVLANPLLVIPTLTWNSLLFFISKFQRCSRFNEHVLIYP